MILYRLTTGEFSNDLSGTGAKLFGGRWNSVGRPALYTAEHISLAVLEILVHMRAFGQPADYHLVTIDTSNTEETIIQLNNNKLKHGWRNDVTYTQAIGDGFLGAQKTLLLKVPSAIIEQENNFIINPSHPCACKIKIRYSKVFMFNKKLYLNNE